MKATDYFLTPVIHIILGIICIILFPNVWLLGLVVLIEPFITVGYLLFEYLNNRILNEDIHEMNHKENVLVKVVTITKYPGKPSLFSFDDYAFYIIYNRELQNAYFVPPMDLKRLKHHYKSLYVYYAYYPSMRYFKKKMRENPQFFLHGKHLEIPV